MGSSQQCITRFAPSPTGQLHLGHLYAALYARDLAAQQGGLFLLRFEDIDRTRVREHFYQSILEDLEFVKIQWDAHPVRQTDRLEAYSEALNTLKRLGVIYPCFCTRKDIARELENVTRAPHGPDGPLYPGTCKNLSKAEIARLTDRHEVPAWRLDAHRAKQLTGPLSFHDSLKGTVEVNHALLGDLVLARKDIGTSYHIAVVIDDAYQQVSDVTRGNDLLDSTHLHRILQSLFNLPEPQYHHHGIVCDSNGERLAKRNAPLSIKQLREQGYNAERMRKLMKKQLILTGSS